MNEQDTFEQDKATFERLFNKNVSDNLTEFLLFTSNKTNTMLNMKIGILTAQISELSDIILEKNNS